MPEKIPNPIPRINDTANPIIPLSIVVPITRIKSFDPNNFKVAITVDSGDGNINSEL